MPERPDSIRKSNLVPKIKIKLKIEGSRVIQSSAGNNSDMSHDSVPDISTFRQDALVQEQVHH